MKIDLVLTACNRNDHYLHLYPLVVKVWKERFNLDCHLILISDTIPEFLEKYTGLITLFPPFDEIHSASIAQVIRILYPCLYENINILITDVDIFPISKKYFIESVSNYPDDVFITYRDAYLKQAMFSTCYNLANSNTWREIFNVHNIEDIKNLLRTWYNPLYDGRKNCEGWFTEQLKLYQYLMPFDKLVILKDKDMNYNRLDKRHKHYIVNNMEKVKEDLAQNVYSDFHCIKPYSKHQGKINKFIEIICSK